MRFNCKRLNSFSQTINNSVVKRKFNINKNFINKNLQIYNGKKFFKIKVMTKHIGYKFGEFSFTRKIGKIHTVK